MCESSNKICSLHIYVITKLKSAPESEIKKKSTADKQFMWDYDMNSNTTTQ